MARTRRKRIDVQVATAAQTSKRRSPPEPPVPVRGVQAVVDVTEQPDAVASDEAEWHVLLTTAGVAEDEDVIRDSDVLDVQPAAGEPPAFRAGAGAVAL